MTETPPARAAAKADAGADFIDAGPETAEPTFPPPESFADHDDADQANADQSSTDQASTDQASTDQASTDQASTEVIPVVSAEPARDTSAPTEQIAAVWHQPEPTEPFHAQHEKPGEWLFEPPDHLAHQHSPPAEVEPLVPMPAGHGQPWEVPLTAGDADRRRRGGLWVSVALTTTLLVCGGGTASAYLLLRDNGARGATDPAAAVDGFMTAVYARQDAIAAGELVCGEARDKRKLSARIEQIKGYANEYEAPSFRWADPAVDSEKDDRATVSVQLTMSTDDEKTSQQTLTFTTIHKTGWLVCEISG